MTTRSSGKRRSVMSGMLERVVPPQIKLSRDPSSNLETKLRELASLYSGDMGRIHEPLGNCPPSLDSARSRRRKQRLLREISCDRLPREEFLREVRLLRASKMDTPEDYWRALNEFISIPMILEHIPLYRDREDSLGSSSYDPAKNRIRIELPQRLGWWNRQYTLAHETAHVAANHEFPVLDSSGSIVRYQRPQERLTRLAPVDEDLPDEDLPRAAVLDLQDEEAELRARYTWLVCGLGNRMLDVGDVKQLS